MKNVNDNIHDILLKTLATPRIDPYNLSTTLDQLLYFPLRRTFVQNIDNLLMRQLYEEH